jgi:hypothetical protein
VNQGGEPGHDDYGLPSVDIQVPDDARDLYRDVQAYHRELRALRRQERSKRWREPLRNSGMALPVVAGFLVLAMIAGMILTIFSANPDLTGIAGPTNGLPAKPVVVSAHRPFTLREPTAAAIAVMPANCRCAGAIRQLLFRAKSAGVTVYFDGSRNSRVAALSGLAPTAYNGTAALAIDAHNALADAYPSRRLEILLVDSRGAVTARSGLHPKSWTTQTLSELKQSR